MGQCQHRGSAEGDAYQGAQDRIEALARGAVENRQAVEGEKSQADEQRSVEIQRREQLRGRRQRAARTRIAKVFNHWPGSRASRSRPPAKWFRATDRRP